MTSLSDLEALVETHGKSVAALFAAVVAIWKTIKFIFRTANNAAERSRKLDVIIAQLMPNGGSSLRDVLDHVARMTMLNERRHWAMLNENEIPMWETDAKGQCTRVNKSYLRMVGKQLEDLLGNGWSSVIDSDERETVWEAWQASLEQQRDFESRFRIETPKGLLCIHNRGYALRDDKNVVIGYWGVARPICKDAQEHCPSGACPYGQEKH